MPLSIPILTYHSANINGSEYHNNDLMAFSQDLEMLDQLDYLIIPLRWIAQWLHGQKDLTTFNRPLIGLSCDDGLDLDYRNAEYFNFGEQVSLLQRLKEFKSKTNQPHAHITSFVIASEQARKKIEQLSLHQQNLMQHDWWQKACDSGLMGIENHSWDHDHPDLNSEGVSDQFFKVQDNTSADQQILQAKQVIDSHIAPHSSSLFAYPWGHYNDFLTNDYFPNNGIKNQIIGAFTCQPEAVKSEHSPWTIPRYVCGRDWRSQNEIENILKKNL